MTGADVRAAIAAASAGLVAEGAVGAGTGTMASAGKEGSVERLAQRAFWASPVPAPS